MKAWRKDGKIFAVLKLRLPRIDGAGVKFDAFNSLYTSLAEAYALAISEKSAEWVAYTRPVSVAVDFEVTDGDNPSSKAELLTVKRTVSINEDGKIRRTERRDVYDLVRGIFVR